MAYCWIVTAKTEPVVMITATALAFSYQYYLTAAILAVLVPFFYTKRFLPGISLAMVPTVLAAGLGAVFVADWLGAILGLLVPCSAFVFGRHYTTPLYHGIKQALPILMGHPRVVASRLYHHPLQLVVCFFPLSTPTCCLLGETGRPLLYPDDPAMQQMSLHIAGLMPMLRLPKDPIKLCYDLPTPSAHDAMHALQQFSLESSRL